jgi:uracil-DNA glycosylase
MFERQLHPTWRELLAEQLPLLKDIEAKVLADNTAIPEPSMMLRVFQRPPADYRVLIVGQDPYPNPEHPIGLSFAVPETTSVFPPTLKNILKELASDLGPSAVSAGNISPWADRGVMLLNRHLSTGAGVSAAHFDFGWEQFTTAAVAALNQVNAGRLVSILWGSKAQELEPVLTGSVIISSPHPSPLSAYRGFFGSRPFSECNKALIGLGLEPIDWSA